MTDHRVYARHSGVKQSERLSIPHIKRCVRAALDIERADVRCEVSVLITDDGGIQGINRRFRGIDEPTDVLSFPMYAFIPGCFDAAAGMIDPETRLLPLGDIILSAERVDAQARMYGQTKERETAYLTIHSMLHLLGYDHADEAADKKRMREREKYIMCEMGYGE